MPVADRGRIRFRVVRARGHRSRKSSGEIADLQQTAQIIPVFDSSFSPDRPEAGQVDGKLGGRSD